MRRRTTIALVTATIAASLAAAPRAGAAAPPPPPTIDGGTSSIPPDAGTVSGSVDVPKSSVVRVDLVTADGDTCPRTMSGDGVEPIPTATATFPMADGVRFQGSRADLRAGLWVYGTATIGGLTSEVSECQRILPGAPDAHLDSVDGGTVTISFVPSLGTTSVRVQAMGPRYDPIETWERPATSPAVVDDLVPGKVYRLQLWPVNDLAGPATSGPQWILTPPFRSLTLLGAQQIADFAGRTATVEERFAWERAILDAPVDERTSVIYERIAAMVDDPDWAPIQDPVTRLYLAYFERLPDPTGLRYWADHRRAGLRAAAISQRFAQSSEFQRRYGSLGNRAFVELVYRNVLGREGDPAGIASWTAKLDRRTRNRGEIMLGFSESSEFVRRTAARVDLVDVTTGMLRRVPTASEVATWAPPGAAVLDRIALVADIFASPEYDQRIS